MSILQKGTTTEQDSRFADKRKKLMKTMKFPSNLDQKVPLPIFKMSKMYCDSFCTLALSESFSEFII